MTNPKTQEQKLKEAFAYLGDRYLLHPLNRVQKKIKEPVLKKK